MDVDLLRPGTVPISPNTILWFEFLLDKDLLVKHLQKPAPDPSPAELITKFTTAVYDALKNEIKRDAENGDLTVDREREPKLSLKVIALKILSMKVAAYIRWNLDTLRTLPFKIQVSVLQDLLFFTNDNAPIEIPHVPDHSADTTEPHLFALIIYHRWLLGTCMFRILNNVQNRTNGDFTPVEENLFCTPDNIERSLAFLTDILTWDKIPPILNDDCFVTLSENSTETQFEWNRSSLISRDEFAAQILYDLAIFYFYRENYALAAEHFSKSAQHFRSVRDRVGFCSIDHEELESYVSACHNQGRDYKSTLLQQLNGSVVNHYMGILNILIQDNKVREIPMTHRVNLELDIQGALSSGKFTVARDLLPKIQALNAVRCIIGQNTSHQYNYRNAKGLEYLVWATAALWKSSSRTDKSLLCSYYMQLIINLQSEILLDDLLQHEILNDIFDEVDAGRLRVAVSKEVIIPDLLHNSYWDFPDAKRNPKLEIRLLEQLVISCYDPQELRDLLVKLTIKNPTRPIWKINPQWELPIPLQSVVTSISRGFLQDFSYVMLAKSKELMLSKDWNSSIDFLRILEAEIQSGSHQKLGKLIGWEILLVQITQLFEEWPASYIDRQAIGQACENSLKNGESVIPRTEVMEQCVLCLLNIGRWEFLSLVDKRLSCFELASVISQACQDVLKYKGSKKFSKDTWDLVIPIFASSSQIKRTSSGSSSIIHRDSPINSTKIELISFLGRLRDSTAMSVLISMLSKLYNILRDDGNFEVSVDYVMLWPSAISNINSYNIGLVSEALMELVQQAIKYYPTNISWLRLMGDINFCNLNYEAGLKYYLQTIIVSSDYFNVTIRPDDHLFRRMIKCCTQLGSHTQAAVLCQFLEEPDYTLAFRSLVDFKSCNDSVEAYYHCFWDINILEYLVHLHNKKGEFQRRKKAIQTIGLLELNSNNNEEIQREAVNLRKRTFLQAMCKQYVR